ncbi:MAG: cytochrome c oxidase accessory protein CcoG [Ignavibacteria bacterium RBG_16_35_7]|nr:MAG: cytochrome c oxidase accessory protein CcoG [Ignavibacteria bacterium RBG_16_35_7]
MSEIKTEESFRDYIATVTKEGKRKWIYPKKPSGRFYNARTVVSLFLILFLVSTPFIKVNGHPFLLFDFLNRNFILFTIPFGPHDFHLFALAIIALAVFVILFTVIFGRVFCGWACPQTIFMEMVFRKIEYWIEGDFKDQTKLNQAPWTSNKIFKKTIKHAIYFPIAFFISNIFLSYVIGMDELIKIITAPPSKHLAGFISMLAFSGIFYWIFSYFREQVCTLVCPYGRLQGVLLDQDSIVIAYDNFRGEPRGKLKKNEAKSKLGDCIDCNLCVDVCPTGIDIRNGIQLECVNCTACIDACDTVMDKIDRPRGLIRYDSLRGIEKKEKFHFTPRMAGYSSILILILSVLSYLLVTRSDLSINILRTPGLLFQEQPDNKCSNIYDLNITNKSFNYTPIELKLKNVEGELKLLGDELNLKPQEKHDSKFLLILPKTSIAKMNTPITILVYSNDKLLKEVKTSFLGPVAEKGKS